MNKSDREKLVVETPIKKYLFSKGAYFFKVHGSAFMEPGIPDIICCYKGLFIGIECKAPGKLGDQSDQQKIHEHNIIQSGGIYLLTDNINDIKNLLDEIDNLEKRIGE